MSFDAFGNRAAHSGAQSAFGFTGNWTDPDTGLLYLRARDYDPKTGQFLTVDPAVDRTRQPYAYAYNSPVSVTDPTGLDAASDAQAKADEELASRPYILLGILQNVLTLGTYGVQQSLCAGNDLWTSMNMVYNPVYAIVEGGTNAVQDIQNGESGFRVFMDVLEFAGGVAGVVGIGLGVGLVGSIGRAGLAGRVGAVGPSALAGEASEGAGNFVYRALNAADRAAPDVAVIGRQADTEILKGTPGYEVLDLPAEQWSLGVNDRWVSSVVDRKMGVYVGSNPTFSSLWDVRNAYPTVFTRELQ